MLDVTASWPHYVCLWLYLNDTLSKLSNVFVPFECHLALTELWREVKCIDKRRGIDQAAVKICHVGDNWPEWIHASKLINLYIQYIYKHFFQLNTWSSLIPMLIIRTILYQSLTCLYCSMYPFVLFFSHCSTNWKYSTVNDYDKNGKL